MNAGEMVSPIVNINGMYPHVWVICTLYNSAHSKQALSQTIPIGELGMRIKGGWTGWYLAMPAAL